MSIRSMEDDHQQILQDGPRSETDQFPQGTKFFQYLKNTHGESTTKLFKSWMKVNGQLALATSRRIFLLQCRSHEVFPKHIDNIKKQSKSSSFFSKFANDKSKNYNLLMRKRLFKLDIKDIHFHITFLNKQLDKLRSQILLCNVDNISVQKFFDLTELRSQNIHKESRFSLNKKLENILKIRKSLL